MQHAKLDHRTASKLALAKLIALNAAVCALAPEYIAPDPHHEPARWIDPERIEKYIRRVTKPARHSRNKFSHAPSATIANTGNVANGAVGNTGTVTAAFGTSNTAGNTLVCCIANNQASAQGTLSISDFRSNTWLLCSSSPAQSSSVCFMYYAPNCAGGSNSITVTVTGGATKYDLSFIAYEYSGLLTACPFEAQSANSGSSNPTSSGSVITQASTDLLVSLAYDDNGTSVTYTPSSGFTLQSTQAGPNFGKMAYFDQMPVAAGTYSNNVAFGTVGTGPSYHVCLVAFRAILPSLGFIQSETNTVSSSTTCAKAFDFPNTAGNLLLAIATFPAGFSTVSASDYAGNAWSSVPILLNPDNETTFAFYAPNCKAGANTVTITISSSQTVSLWIGEYCGIATSNPLIGATGKIATSSTTCFTEYVVPTSQALLIGFGSGQKSASGVTLSPSSGFMGRGEVQNGSSQLLAFDQVASAGAVGATVTSSSAPNWLLSGLVAFATSTVPKYRRQVVAGTSAFANLSGNLLMTFAVSDATATWGISDLLGNSWTLMQGGPGSEYAIWYCLSALGGSNVVTVTNSGAGFLGWHCIEYAISGAVYDTSTVNSGTGSGGISTGSITTSYANELLICSGYILSGDDTDLQGNSPWSHVGRCRVHDAFGAFFDQLVSVTGTYSNSLVANNGNSYGFVNAIGAFHWPSAAPFRLPQMQVAS